MLNSCRRFHFLRRYPLRHYWLNVSMTQYLGISLRTFAKIINLTVEFVRWNRCHKKRAQQLLFRKKHLVCLVPSSRLGESGIAFNCTLYMMQWKWSCGCDLEGNFGRNKLKDSFVGFSPLHQPHFNNWFSISKCFGLPPISFWLHCQRVCSKLSLLKPITLITKKSFFFFFNSVNHSRIIVIDLYLKSRGSLCLNEITRCLGSSSI